MKKLVNCASVTATRKFNLQINLLTFLFQVMGGQDSDMYKYFKMLILQGLIAARKHSDRIISLVDIMRAGKQINKITSLLKSNYLLMLGDCLCLIFITYASFGHFRISASMFHIWISLISSCNEI